MGRPASDPAASEVELDFQIGIQRVGGNTVVYNDLLRDFIAELPDRLEQLWSFYRDRDVNGLNRVAHSLKGVSANLGALQMSAKARRLEKQATQGYTESIAQLLQEIQLVVSKLLEISNNFLAEKKISVESV